MKKRFGTAYAIYLVLFTLVANSTITLVRAPWLVPGAVLLLLFLFLFAGLRVLRATRKRLNFCCHGVLLVYVAALSVVFSAVYHVALARFMLWDSFLLYLFSIVVSVAATVLLLAVGLLSIFFSSAQLGVVPRLVYFPLILVPVINLFALHQILKIATEEIFFEGEKDRINAARRAQRVCHTKYPVLLVHGIFFRDVKYSGYWGRIPKELQQNGAVIYYGRHRSAAAVEVCAADIAERIRTIVEETGCEKVNIIAHSKGGFDCRYAIANLGIAPYVASLTTISTPHRGCEFADYLLEHIPVATQHRLANAYNATLRRFGDKNPDFLAGVRHLTAAYCKPMDLAMPYPKDIFCQSVGSTMMRASGGTFPMNYAYHLVKYFEGENDGLTSESSFAWGERYTLLKASGRRGISHGDVIDLTRENIPGFDVREFYVSIVAELKEKGL